MEEKENVETKPTYNEKQFKISNKLLYLILGLAALVIYIIYRICINFGVGSLALRGIISIVVYGLSLTGMILSWLGVKKMTFEFWFNLGVLAFTLIYF